MLGQYRGGGVNPERGKKGRQPKADQTNLEKSNGSKAIYRHEIERLSWKGGWDK